MRKIHYQTIAVILAFCLSIGAAFFFGYRASTRARQMKRQNEPIRAWMSIPFVAHVHHTDPGILFDAIHVPVNPHDRRPIREIAREEHVPPANLIRELQGALDKAPKK